MNKYLPKTFFSGLDYTATTTANRKEKIQQAETIRDKET